MRQVRRSPASTISPALAILLSVDHAGFMVGAADDHFEMEADANTSALSFSDQVRDLAPNCHREFWSIAENTGTSTDLKRSLFQLRIGICGILSVSHNPTSSRAEWYEGSPSQLIGSSPVLADRGKVYDQMPEPRYVISMERRGQTQ